MGSHNKNHRSKKSTRQRLPTKKLVSENHINMSKCHKYLNSFLNFIKSSKNIQDLNTHEHGSKPHFSNLVILTKGETGQLTVANEQARK